MIKFPFRKNDHLKREKEFVTALISSPIDVIYLIALILNRMSIDLEIIIIQIVICILFLFKKSSLHIQKYKEIFLFSLIVTGVQG